jgi:hypothetical protein
VLRAERSSCHCRGKGADQADLKTRIGEIARTHVRYGYRSILHKRYPPVADNWAGILESGLLSTLTPLLLRTVPPVPDIIEIS